MSLDLHGLFIVIEGGDDKLAGYAKVMEKKRRGLKLIMCGLMLSLVAGMNTED